MHFPTFASSHDMGGKFSALVSARRLGADEFFFDDFRQQWRWHWAGTWWTIDPLFDDEPETGMLRKGWCWVSDCGGVWYGLDPELWCRRHRRRQAIRRWLHEERSRCKCAAMCLRRTTVPDPLAQAILGRTFGGDITEDFVR